MMETPGTSISPGTHINLNQLQIFHFYDFYHFIKSELEAGADVIHFYGFRNHPKERLKIVTILRNKQSNLLKLYLGFAISEYLSFTPAFPKFFKFEQLLFEEFGIKPLGHPGLAFLRKREGDSDPYYKSLNYHSDGHQIGVGPVHAGVISPGRFNFYLVGEEIKRLQIKLGFQHRGIEALILDAFEKKGFSRLLTLVEGVSGDQAVSHGLALTQIIESIESKPEKVLETNSLLRTLLLEIERVSNHLGDLGALSGDLAFLTAANYFGRLRGEFLNMLLLFSGNRFGKTLLIPFGMRLRNSISLEEDLFAISNKIKKLLKEVIDVGDLFFSASSVQQRLQGVCKIDSDEVKKLGGVGLSARASGIAYDVRSSFPYESYLELPFKIYQLKSGDLYARARLRLLESLHSLHLIVKMTEILLNKSPLGILYIKEERASLNNFPHTLILPPNSLYISLVESYLGEISHLMMTNSEQKVITYRIKDPSFTNWMLLEKAMENGEISDFPLCNKSFNFSYGGHDL